MKIGRMGRKVFDKPINAIMNKFAKYPFPQSVISEKIYMKVQKRKKRNKNISTYNHKNGNTIKKREG